MAGSKVNNFSIGDSNIQSVMLTLDKAYKGFHQVSLTNYDNTSESQVAAGSVIENNGGLYKFDSNESISGSPTDGTVYVRVVPSGDSATLEYTNTAPTWSDSKQGWYGTGADANKRYIEFVIIKASSLWNKYNDMSRFFQRDKKARMLYNKSGINQTITGSGTVEYTTKVFDLDSNYSTNKFIAKKDGYYYISASADVKRNGTYVCQFSIYKNGVQTIIGNGFGDGDPDVGEVSRYCVVSGILYLETGDEINIGLRQDSFMQIATLVSSDSAKFIFSVFEL